MRPLPRVLATAVLGFIAAEAAIAGPHEDGVLILHAVPYQSRSGPLCERGVLGDCQDARVSTSSGTWNWIVFAAFPEGSSPRLMGVTLGIDYDDHNAYIIDYQSCALLEIPDADWPAPGSGTAVTWGIPQTGQLTRVYGFVGYAYYGDATTFCLAPHPTQGGWFGDDSIPSQLDQIADYGCIGFNSNPGYLPCPVPVKTGACCLQDGSCQITTENACTAEGGRWLGPDSECDPDPCLVPAIEQSWGATKRQFH